MILAKAGLVLSLLATAVDFFYANSLVLYSDILLLLGSAATLIFSRSDASRRRLVWWPFFLGYWSTTCITILETGGIHSPIAGISLATLFVGTTVGQTRCNLVETLSFTLLNVLGWAVWSFLNPAPALPVQPLGFLSLLQLIHIATLGVCIYGFLKTERDLASEFNERYRELFNARADLSREEAANAAKSTFLANVSHELRTPLGAIMGFAELIQDPDATIVEKNEYAETIQRNGQELTRLVNDLLDITKLEAGKIEIENLEFCPTQAITEITELLRFKAQQKGIEITTSHHEVPAALISDPLRIKQIVMNLVGNSIKFTENGCVHVETRFVAPDRWIVDVRDTGCGMTPAEQAKLFQPFSQVDASMSRRQSGTGLGLSLSRRLARLLGGDLTIQSSEPGRGSVFRLSVVVSVGQGAISRTSDRGLPLTQLKGRHILVVDDAPDNRHLIRKYLEGSGATVSLAASGHQAISMSAGASIDLVLMDIQMPEIDGLETTALLRQSGFAAPIVALTAHAMQQDRKRCFEAGCADYISKPVSRGDLITKVSALLEAEMKTRRATGFH